MSLLRYSVWRLTQAIPVLIGIIAITFFLANQIPGDPVEIMLGPTPAQEQVEAIQARYGLDRPAHERFLTYLSAVATGDLGSSIYYDRPVLEMIILRFPVTMLLMLSAFAFAIITAIPLGVISAKRRNEPADHVSRIVSLIGVSTPSFWIGLVLTLPMLVLDMSGPLTGLNHVVVPQMSNWIQLFLATPVVAWYGWPFFVRGWKSALRRSLNMFNQSVSPAGAAHAGAPPGRASAIAIDRSQGDVMPSVLYSEHEPVWEEYHEKFAVRYCCPLRACSAVHCGRRRLQRGRHTCKRLRSPRGR